MTAGVLKKCPQCGQLSLKRLIGPGAAVLFKGSGFYTTDYRSASYQKQAKADSEKTEIKNEESKSPSTCSEPQARSNGKTTDKKSKSENRTSE
jgi:hypothetical protein